MHIDKYKQADGWYLDEEGVSYEDAGSFLGTKILDFCGCGNPDSALEYVRDVMQNIKGKDFDSRKYDGKEYFVWYYLDNKELTDHGSSVPGWLTEKGEEFLEDLNEYLATLEKE